MIIVETKRLLIHFAKQHKCDILYYVRTSATLERQVSVHVYILGFVCTCDLN
jgi:hypothetical protein